MANPSRALATRRVWLGAALFLPFAPARALSAGAWLYREWELTHDPDGDPKDFIEFFEGGQVVHTAHHGRRTTGAFVVRGEDVRVTFMLPQGRTLSLVYAVGSGGRRLLLRSQKTGAVAIYEPRRRGSAGRAT